MASTKSAKTPAFISPPDLFTVLCSSSRVLVFDVRDKEDYLKERIWSSVHLNLQKYPNINQIARELLITRQHTDAVNNADNCPVTPHTHRRLFVNRSLYHIVVVDEDGSDSRKVIAQLSGSHKPVQLLVGGYKMFNTLYPALCVGSSGEDRYLIDKCEKEWGKDAPVEVLPDVFFGDVAAAQNFMVIDILGIESMVNAAAFVDNFEPTAYKYLRCDQEELPEGDLAPLFSKVFKFIESAKGEGDKVLIYSAGNDDGRAGMFVCAYLMRLNDWSLEKSFIHFKRKCPTFSPNVAILARLGEYETALSGTKHLEESIKNQQEGVKEGRVKVSEELKYVRRQQAHQLEEAREQAAEEEEEDLC